jgi:AcrR family transcriptional regulator
VVATDDDRRGYRYRLVTGLAAAVVERGYPATTIADIVRHARVSKRTFYEHFADKESCFLAAYAAGSRMLRRAVEDAVEGEPVWTERVHAGVHAYLGALASQPALSRTLLLEVPAAGPRAIALRRRELGRFAQMIGDLARRDAAEHPDLRTLDADMCVALVGGINELTMLALEEGRVARLPELTPTVVDLIKAVLTVR